MTSTKSAQAISPLRRRIRARSSICAVEKIWFVQMRCAAEHLENNLGLVQMRCAHRLSV